MLPWIMSLAGAKYDKNFRFLSLVVILVFASGIYAVPPQRGIDPLEAKRKARIDK